MLVLGMREICPSFLLEDIWELHSLALPPQLLAKRLQLPQADTLFHHCRGGLDTLPLGTSPFPKPIQS